MTRTFTAMIADESGASLVEYGLILSLIAVVAIAALTHVGAAVTNKLTAASQAMGGQ